MILRRLASFLAILMAGPFIGGCPPGRQPVTRTVAEPKPLWKAVFHVNDNADRIDGTLRATGFVDCFFTDDGGRRRNFHADGVLFFLTPRYLRFDLKKLGDSQVLLGSNNMNYWMYTREHDDWVCGRHGIMSDLPTGIPVRSDQLVDALGLNPINLQGEAAEAPKPAQRITDYFQQVLFFERDDFGSNVISKEYWIDRYAPHLIRRVVFRDLEGRIEMDSRLDEFRALEPGGPLVPGVITAEWPGAEAKIRFKINKWKRFEQVTPDAIQFRTPRQCVQP